MYDSGMLGENLRRIRQEHGLTQAALAERINITPQNISKWEKGMCLPDLTKLCLLSDALGVSPDVLVCSAVAEKVYVAIDGGGTKTEFCLFNEAGEVLERVVLGASNPNVVGIKMTEERLKSGIDALMRGNYQVAKIYAGIAGCGVIGKSREGITAYLKSRYPTARVTVDSDMPNIAYSTEYYDRCIIAIVGTGSVVAASSNGSINRIGGWGYLFDEGFSGFGLGRDAVLAALRENDGVGEHTLLSEYLERELGADIFSSLGVIYSDNNKRVGTLAPLVFDAYRMGDRVAIEIVERRIRSLYDMITVMVERYGYKDVVLAGGLTREVEIIRKYFKDAPFSLHFPDLPPIYGAAVRCIMDDKKVDMDFKRAFENTYRAKEGE